MRRFLSSFCATPTASAPAVGGRAVEIVAGLAYLKPKISHSLLGQIFVRSCVCVLVCVLGRGTISDIEPVDAVRPEGTGAADGRSSKEEIRFRTPRPEDGPGVTALIANCPPLDINSAYCNLLQCTHFADTCVLAERGDTLVGWISAYRPPSNPDRIFVWQVAVDEAARGEGLGGRMLAELISRPSVRGCNALITTVTEDNEASWAMFGGFAERHGLTMSKEKLFERERHFAGEHDTEWQATIGPLKT